MKKLIAIYEVLFWFFSGASIIYPDMTRWQVAKKIYNDVVNEDKEDATKEM